MDSRKLKADAAEAAAKGKHKKALEKYLDLERLEPKDGGWARRAGEMYRQLGRVDEGIAAFQRAADKYAASGLVTKASAVCQTILRMRPGDADARARLDKLVPPAARRAGGPGAFPRPQSVSDLSREELAADAAPRARVAVETAPEPPRVHTAAEPEPRVRAGGSIPPPVPAGGPAGGSGPRAAKAPARPAPPAADDNLDEMEELDAELLDEVEADPDDNEAGGELAAAAGLELEAEPDGDLAAAAGLELDAGPDDDLAAVAGFELEVDDAAASAEPELDRDEVLQEVLASNPLFAPFDAGEAMALAERFEVAEVPAGETLVEAGVLAERLIVIARGELALDRDGGQVRAPSGAVLGTTSLLSRAPEPATARAVTSCVVLALPSTAFREVIMTHPMLLAQLAEA